MEFEKLREIIADVMNIDDGGDYKKILLLKTIWVRTRWMYFRLSWALKTLLILRFDNDEAEKIVTVGDAVEQIKNATN